MPVTISDLKTFLRENLAELSDKHGGGTLPDPPKFDLYAHDYLQFAAFELDKYNQADQEQIRVSHLINCISSLKRALENQLDVFIGTFGAGPLLKRSNVPSKLALVAELGLLEGRSFSRIQPHQEPT